MLRHLSLNHTFGSSLLPLLRVDELSQNILGYMLRLDRCLSARHDVD